MEYPAFDGLKLLFAMAPQGGESGGGGMFSTLIFFALIFVIFYFMILRPQQKRAKERQKMLDSPNTNASAPRCPVICAKTASGTSARRSRA